MKLLLFLYSFSILFFSCSVKNEPDLNLAKCDQTSIHISLVQVNDTLAILKPSKESNNSNKNWSLPYPIYQFTIADVDNDGCDEILVGVIKATHFDNKEAKRLFIFKLFEGHIRPKWLGSRLGQPIVDFKTIVESGDTKILSLEMERSGNYLIAKYEWRGFGLQFIEYIYRELEPNVAKFRFYLMS